MRFKTTKIFITIGLFCLYTMLASQMTVFSQINTTNDRLNRETQKKRKLPDLRIVNVLLDKNNQLLVELFNISEGNSFPDFYYNKTDKNPLIMEIRQDNKIILRQSLAQFDPDRKIQKGKRLMVRTGLEISKKSRIQVVIDSTAVFKESNDLNNLQVKTLVPKVIEKPTTSTTNKTRIRTSRITLEEARIKDEIERLGAEPYLVVYEVRAKVGRGTPTVILNKYSGQKSIVNANNWAEKGVTRSIPTKIGQTSFENLQDYEVYGLIVFVMEEDQTSRQDLLKFMVGAKNKIADSFKREFQRPTNLSGTHQEKLDATVLAYSRAISEVNGLDDLYKQMKRKFKNSDNFFEADNIFSIAVPSEKVSSLKELIDDWGLGIYFKESARFTVDSRRTRFMTIQTPTGCSPPEKGGCADFQVYFRHEEFVQ